MGRAWVAKGGVFVILEEICTNIMLSAFHAGEERRSNLWGDVHEHHGFGLALQRVLQQLSQLGVAEGRVAVLIGQAGHHVPQRRQALIDVLCLLQAIPRRLAPAHPLAACTKGETL